MAENYYIIRGFYLTGFGQEKTVHYFKIGSDHSDFKVIKAGDVCLTFYQNQKTLTSLPALIRVDGVIMNERQVQSFIESEQTEHIPLVPIVQIYDAFDPLVFKTMMTSCQSFDQDIKKLAEFHVVQGTIFDFLEED